MTRPHNHTIDCPECGSRITAETSFGRWLRNHPQLDSSQGLYAADQDYWILRFRTHLNREFQLLMLVEIKTFDSEPNKYQDDMLAIVGQLTRNRRQTPTKPLEYQAGTSSTRVWSPANNRDILVKAFGFHILRFSGRGPDDSKTIHWDNKEIGIEQLVGLLNFDLDPDTLSVLDLRSHHVEIAPSIGINFDEAAA